MRCGLAVVGCHKSRLFSKATYEKYADLCASSHLPLGIDDPKTKNTISNLTVALFNGAEEVSVKRGEHKFLTTAVIGANFTTKDAER